MLQTSDYISIPPYPASGRLSILILEVSPMSGIELSKELRQDLLGSIKEFFLKERDEELSDFQASLLLDFILAELAPPIYNQAIEDAHRFMAAKIEDLYGLEKRPR